MIVTRFAPSPTGYLHIGGLRTALFNYLWARKNGGKFLLRIEDTDLSRNSEDALKAILEAFDWVGLNYDGEVEYQSKRFDIYKIYIEKLLESGDAYYCYMSKEELDNLREEQSKAGLTPRYDRRYRDFRGIPPEGVTPVVRIKAPLDGEVRFIDGVKGEVKFNSSELDDFIIARSDGTPTYNFVVAIDDALMGVTDVIRGDDHLSNTPKQIIIYNALKLNVPKFFHVPMILNPQGKKLSKRDGATDVMEYQKMGYLPEALLNFLVRLGWSHGDQEIFSMEEMLRLFNPDDINRSASAYNAEKLNWLNAHYIKNIPNERLARELESFGLFLISHDKKEILLDCTKERTKSLLELADMVKDVINTPSEYDEKAVIKHINQEALIMLKNFKGFLGSYEGDLHLPTDYKDMIDNFLSIYHLKLNKFAQPIRIALVGKAVSPSIFDVMAVLGRVESFNRIDNAISKLCPNCKNIEA